MQKTRVEMNQQQITMNNFVCPFPLPPIESRNIFLGRGNGVGQLPGNKFYRNTIKANKPFYKNAGANAAKERVAKDIVEFMKRYGCVFYYQRHKEGPWEAVPESELLKRVKQALREKDKDEKKSKKDPSSSTSTSTSTSAGDKEKKKKPPTKRKAKRREFVGIKMDNKIIAAIRWKLEGNPETIGPDSTKDAAAATTLKAADSKDVPNKSKSSKKQINAEPTDTEQTQSSTNINSTEILTTTINDRRQLFKKHSSLDPKQLMGDTQSNNNNAAQIQEKNNYAKSLNQIDFATQIQASDIQKLSETLLRPSTYNIRENEDDNANVRIDSPFNSTDDNIAYMPSSTIPPQFYHHDQSTTMPTPTSVHPPSTYDPLPEKNAVKRSSMPMMTSFSQDNDKALHRASLPIISSFQQSNMTTTQSPSIEALKNIHDYMKSNDQKMTSSVQSTTNVSNVGHESQSDFPLESSLQRKTSDVVNALDEIIFAPDSNNTESVVSESMKNPSFENDTPISKQQTTSATTTAAATTTTITTTITDTIGQSKKEDLSAKANDVLNDLDGIIQSCDTSNVTKVQPQHSFQSITMEDQEATESEDKLSNIQTRPIQPQHSLGLINFHDSDRSLKPHEASKIYKDFSMFATFDDSASSLQMHTRALERSLEKEDNVHNTTLEPTPINAMKKDMTYPSSSSYRQDALVENDDDDDDSEDEVRPGTPTNLLKDISMYSVLGTSNWSLHSNNNGEMTPSQMNNLGSLMRQRSSFWAKNILKQDGSKDDDDGEDDDRGLTAAPPGDLSKGFSNMSIEP